MSDFNNTPIKFSDRELKISQWYIEHKLLLKKILIAFLLLVSFVTFSLTIYSFAYYFIKGEKKQEQMINSVLTETVNINQYKQYHKVKKLKFSHLYVLNSSKNKSYDFAIEVYNPNSRYLALFDYSFYYSNKKTDKKSAYILPKQKKFLFILAWKTGNRPSNVRFNYENFHWKRISKHDIADLTSYIKSHLNFDIKNVKLVKGQDLSTIKFDFKNTTPYNYWELNFNILLRYGDRLTGINNLVLGQIRSGDERKIRFVWQGELPNYDSIKIMPLVNIFDKNVYMRFKDNGRIE